jgi:hypothetical protein
MSAKKRIFISSVQKGLELERPAVAGAKRLNAKMEANIRAVIGRVWGEKP